MKIYKSSKMVLILVIVLLITLMTGSLAAAQDGGGTLEPVAAVEITSDQVTWQPLATFEAILLTVGGPDGFTYGRIFAGGEWPYFGLYQEDGSLLPDGVYTYQLTVLAQVEFLHRGDAEAQESEIAAQATLVQSGAFSILGGTFILPGEIEEVQAIEAVEDQVIIDDLIVDGSACVGFDCVSGESFGFDTIRLKENNLRIKFEDTSASAGFATNDWQITANDTASGGASYLAFDDIDGGKTPFKVMAGARTNALFVASSGRVGLGTSSPVLTLHIAVGDTPGVRLDQDGSYGYAPQVWDIAGNESNFFIRDATHGSLLPFRIVPGAPTNSIFLLSSGNVGLGTGSPAAALHLQRTNGTAQLLIEEASTTSEGRTLLELKNNGNITLRFDNTTGTNPENWEFFFNEGGNVFQILESSNTNKELRLTSTGNLIIAGGLTQNSDVNAKNNILAVDNREVLAKVAALPVSTWKYNGDESNATHMGPMAQDFYASFGLGMDDTSLAPSDLAGVALASVQALNAELNEKDAQIAALEARIAELEQASGFSRGPSASDIVTWVLLGLLSVGMLFMGWRYRSDRRKA